MRNLTQLLLLIVILIIGTTCSRFMERGDLGFQEEILIIKLTNPLTIEEYTNVNNEIANINYRDSIWELWHSIEFSYSSSYPTEQLPDVKVTYNEISNSSSILYAGKDFAQVYGFEIVEGRDFSQEFIDTSAVIINQILANSWENEIMGKKIILQRNGSSSEVVVVGVVKDMFFENKRGTAIKPLVIKPYSDTSQIKFLNIRLYEGLDMQTIADVKNKLNEILGADRYEVLLLKDVLDDFYGWW